MAKSKSDPVADGKAIDKRAKVKELTTAEARMDRADGRRTRVQQRGRLRS